MRSCNHRLQSKSLRFKQKTPLLCEIIPLFHRFTATFTEDLAIAVFTRLAVIDAIAVANVKAVSGAKAPNRVLHEPRKHPRKPRVKGASVDLGGGRPNDLGAAAFAIAADAIAMGSATILNDAGAMQKVMDQGVDGDHAFAGLEPMRPTIRGPKQQPGEGHGEDLVGDPVDIPQRADQPLLAVCGEVYAGGDRSESRMIQPVVDPADQVIVGNVTDKEKKAVGGLV
jgi:hypothetical protein